MARPEASVDARGEAADLSDDDRDLLSFVAVHERVGADHAAAFSGLSAARSAEALARLEAGGLVRAARGGRGRPAVFRITHAGLTAVGSDLPVPRPGAGGRRELAVVWLWLAARGGAFGPVERVLSARQLRAVDGAEAPGSPPRARADAGAVHVPDVLLVLEQGRVPVELRLSLPDRGLESVLRSYASDPEVAAVVFLVADARVGQCIQDEAARLGLTRLVHVQPAQFPA